jgi:hypothetical protein
MFLFIALALGLCFIQETASPLATLLVSPIFIYGGLVTAIVSIVSLFFQKIPEKIACDIFSSGTLLLWFAYWNPLFGADSPIFFFYPLFFAVMSALFTLFLSNQNHRIDKESLRYMRYVNQERVMSSWFIMVCVLLSLLVHQHYQLYMVLMVLLMLRLAFSSCIEEESS